MGNVPLLIKPFTEKHTGRVYSVVNFLLLRIQQRISVTDFLLAFPIQYWEGNGENLRKGFDYLVNISSFHRCNFCFFSV